MKLKVIYKNQLDAGELWNDREGYHFKYYSDFINNPETIPISVNFPKVETTFHSSRLFAFFYSILTEGEQKKEQTKALGIDPADTFTRLALTKELGEIGGVTLKLIEK